MAAPAHAAQKHHLILQNEMVYRVLCMYRIVLSFVFRRMGFNLDTIDPMMVCVHLVFFSLASCPLPAYVFLIQSNVERKLSESPHRQRAPAKWPANIMKRAAIQGDGGREREREKSVYTNIVCVVRAFAFTFTNNLSKQMEFSFYFPH